MKKLLLLTFLLSYSIIFSQQKDDKKIILKETWSLGGQISFNSSNFENNLNSSNFKSKSSGISINPEIGYALYDNLILGVGIGYSYFQNETLNTPNSKSSSNNFNISPYLKKLFPINKQLLLSIRGEFSFSIGKEEYNQTNNISTKSYFIGVRPGITYFISDKISLDANLGGLGYSHFIRDYNNNQEKSNSFNFDLNSSNLFFGFTYYLN